MTNANRLYTALCLFLVLEGSAHAADDKMFKGRWAKEEDKKPVYALPDITNEMELSVTDVNWLRCKGTVEDVAHSEDKNIVVERRGGNAYIKFNKEEGACQSGDACYVRRRSEFIVKCDGRMYKILGYPEYIPSKTIILSDGMAERMEANRKENAGISEDERTLRMIRQVFKEEIPETWEVQEQIREVQAPAGLKVELKRVIRQEGEGIQVLDFVIRNEGAPVKLQEKDFHRIEFSKAPVAIMVEPQNLNRGEEARLLIAEERGLMRGLPLIPKDSKAQEAPEPQIGETKEDHGGK